MSDTAIVRDLLSPVNPHPPTTGGILDTPCGSCFAGSTRIERGEHVRHGDIIGVVDDIFVTSVGSVRIGIACTNGAKYFAEGARLTQRRTDPFPWNE